MRHGEASHVCLGPIQWFQPSNPTPTMINGSFFKSSFDLESHGCRKKICRHPNHGRLVPGRGEPGLQQQRTTWNDLKLFGCLNRLPVEPDSSSDLRNNVSVLEFASCGSRITPVELF